MRCVRRNNLTSRQHNESSNIIIDATLQFINQAHQQVLAVRQFQAFSKRKLTRLEPKQKQLQGTL